MAVGTELGPYTKREVVVTLEETTPEAITAFCEVERSVEHCEGNEKCVNCVAVEDAVERHTNTAYDAVSEHSVACLKLRKRCP